MCLLTQLLIPLSSGAFFGALIAFFIGERLGRRWMMMLGGFIMIIGTVIGVAAFGPHWGFGQFIISRIVGGIGNGMVSNMVLQ